MLDFAFGPNGYGFGEGMRKEQDRITQNRSTFANNMATFLANNPYISPEAAQAFINSAAGTDLTLVGSVPNQLVGEINQENQRKRRIDNFRFFNEYLRANPGATAVEMQDALSALGAQGIYGEKAIKVIQQRSDQYRKDVETKRQFENAQNIGQLRTAMMNDVNYQYAANSYDPDKTIKALKGIYGDNPPIPYESLVNPGSAAVAKQQVVREYAPKVIDILNKNPGFSPDLISRLYPELNGSPIIKDIYEAAQTERKNAVQSKFNTNRLPIIDSAVKLMQMGRTRDEAIQQAALSADLTPADLQNLDLASAAEAAEVQFKKITADAETALQQKQAQASANVASGILSGLSNEMEAKRLAAMSDSQLELEIRKKVEMVSGLTKDEINSLPYQWYNNIATSVRGELNTRALASQQQRYDAARGIETTAADAIRKDSAESAKNATSEEALTFLGLNDAASGGGIQAAVRDLATRYDMSGGRAGTAIQLAMDILDKNPNAATDLTRALEGDIRFKQMFRPITEEAAQQANTMRIRTGSDQPRPVGFTPWVQQEAAQIRKESDNYLATVKDILGNKATAEEKLNALSNFESRFNNNLAEVNAAYSDRRSSQHIWTQPNDQWNDDKFSEVRIEIQALQTRVQVEIERAKAQLAREVESQRQTNMAPGKVMERPDDPNRSGFVNDALGVFSWTPERMQINDIQYQILAAMPGEYGVGGYFTSSQGDRDLSQRMAAIAQDMGALNYIRTNPEVFALISPDNPNRDVRKFLQIMEARR